MTKNFKSFVTLAVFVALLGVFSLSSCSGKSASGNDSTAVEASEGNDAVADSIAQAISEIQADFNEELPFSQLASAATVLNKYFDIASKTVKDSLKAYVKSLEEPLLNKPIKFESSPAAGVEFEEAFVKGISVQPTQVDVSISYKTTLKESKVAVFVAVDKDNKIVSKMLDKVQPSQYFHYYVQGDKANVVKFVVCTKEEVENKELGSQF